MPELRQRGDRRGLVAKLVGGECRGRRGERGVRRRVRLRATAAQREQQQPAPVNSSVDQPMRRSMQKEGPGIAPGTSIAFSARLVRAVHATPGRLLGVAT